MPPSNDAAPQAGGGCRPLAPAKRSIAPCAIDLAMPPSNSAASIESRAAKVSLVTGASTVMSIMFQVVSVPVCLHFWGAQGYGAWLAIFAAATLLRAVDGGYITYAGNRLNILYHNDQDALRRVLAAGVLATATLGVVQLAALGLVVLLGGLGWLLGDAQLAVSSNAQSGLVILVISWILTGSYIGLIHRLMIPIGMLYQAAWWAMGMQVALFAAIMLAAILRLGLLGTSLLVAGAQASLYLASADYVRRKRPDLFPWWRAPNWNQAFIDIRGSLVFTISGALQQATTNGLVLVVSGGLGAAAVPAFTTVRTLANLWTNVTNVLTSPLLPDIVRFHAQHKSDKLLTLAKAHAWMVRLLVNAGVVISLPLLAWIYRAWTHGQLQLDTGLLAGLLGWVLLLNAGSFMSTYLTGINHAQAVLWLAMVRAVVGLGVAWALLPKLGLVAAGVGLMGSEAICYLLMAVHFYPSAVPQTNAPTRHSIPMDWSMASVAVTLLMVMLVGLKGRVPLTPWIATLFLVLFFAWSGWQRLDARVRSRMLALAGPLGRITVR